MSKAVHKIRIVGLNHFILIQYIKSASRFLKILWGLAFSPIVFSTIRTCGFICKPLGDAISPEGMPTR